MTKMLSALWEEIEAVLAAKGSARLQLAVEYSDLVV
jgi:hypothetical protein